MPRRFLWGLIPALIYVVAAVSIAASEFHCSGEPFSLCGLGTLLVTAPSSVTLGRIFARRGWTIDFMHSSPDIFEVTQLTIHIAVCALLVFLLGYGFGWIVSKFGVGLGRTRVPSSASDEAEAPANAAKTSESLRIFKL